MKCFSRSCPRVGGMRLRLEIISLLFSLMVLPPLSAQDERERASLMYGEDANIKISMKGRAGNLELKSSETQGEGFSLIDYQQGSGYVYFDRQEQVFTWETKIGYTVNRLSKHILKVAPYLKAEVPRGAELDFQLDINSLGFGSLSFEDLNITRFQFDVNYGDVDINFPSENQRIIRGIAKIHLMTGDLEIYNLGNLKARKVKINGGVGELSVDFGPRIYQDTEVRLDHDIGSMELRIPRGTKAVISGTSRDLSGFGFQKSGKEWTPESHHEGSPSLYIKLKGPLGDLKIFWD